MRARRISAMLALMPLAALLQGCSKASPPERVLFAETASFDLSAGTAPRLMVGVSDRDGNSLTGGTVQLRIRRGDRDDAPWSTPVSATSLAIPGRPAPTGSVARLTAPSQAVGVYASGPVTIPEPGIWEIEVDAGPLGTAMTAFEAADEPQAVAVGAAAPPTDNPTLSTPGVKASQLDSLALDGGLDALPHPELHRTSVAEAIADHRPVVVIVATPAYCQSRFCGPLVDEMAALMSEFPDLDAVMLEVFPDGYDKPVSAHAARWIAAGGVPGGAGNEPWVFTVDRSGTVTARWDNVVDLDAVRAELRRLRA